RNVAATRKLPRAATPPHSVTPDQVRLVHEAALRAALSSLAHPGASPFAAVRRLILPGPDPARSRPGEPLSARCETNTSSAASPRLLVRDHRLTTSLSWGLRWLESGGVVGGSTETSSWWFG
ncbi:hypothetical protein Droror1_Dr00020036, partial [Drosera rotundifolia]